jgi:hypothetical protein
VAGAELIIIRLQLSHGHPYVAFDVAFRGKAGMAIALHMSAYDQKRTYHSRAGSRFCRRISRKQTEDIMRTFIVKTQQRRAPARWGTRVISQILLSGLFALLVLQYPIATASAAASSTASDQPINTGLGQRHRLCVTQSGGSCNKTNAFFVCGELTVAQMANAICAIRTESGTQFFPSEAKVVESYGGGRCGVAVVDVICSNMPADSKVEWHYKGCIGQRPESCRTRNKDAYHFGCGATERDIAKTFCTKDGVTAPYQIFPYSVWPGNRCGYAIYAVGCHVPKS